MIDKTLGGNKTEELSEYTAVPLIMTSVPDRLSFSTLTIVGFKEEDIIKKRDQRKSGFVRYENKFIFIYQKE